MAAKMVDALRAQQIAEDSNQSAASGQDENDGGANNASAGNSNENSMDGNEDKAVKDNGASRSLRSESVNSQSSNSQTDSILNNDVTKRSSPAPSQGDEPPNKKQKPEPEKEAEPFDPVKVGLASTFSLLKYAECRAKKCKVSTTAIDNTLRAIQNSETDPSKDGTQGLSMDVTILGSGARFPGLAMLQTQEIIYPIIDDPYMLGRIACTALLSNMYAVGVCEIDNILMKLSVSQVMENADRDIILPLMIKGFRDTARRAKTRITGGETVINPWCMIGGVATAVCTPAEYNVPDKCTVGDVLVLTKPLGTQIAVNCYNWLKNTNPLMWQKVKMVVNEEDVKKSYSRAISVMSRLNLGAAKLMHKYKAHAATSIAGFGVLGHAMALARCQKNEVSFVIHNLPVIAKMASVAKTRGSMFPLSQGLVSEMSGGLLICLPREQAAAFCKEIEQLEGSQAWIIGIVEKGDRTARIIEKPRVIEVPFKDKDGELW